MSEQKRVGLGGSDTNSVYYKEVQAFKRNLLQQTLEAHDDNRTYAARALGISVSHLIGLIKELSIVVPCRQGRPRAPESFDMFMWSDPDCSGS